MKRTLRSWLFFASLLASLGLLAAFSVQTGSQPQDQAKSGRAQGATPARSRRCRKPSSSTVDGPSYRLAPTWPGVGAALLLPWLPWLVLTFLEKGGTFKVAGFEASLAGQGLRLLDLTRPLAALDELTATAREYDPEVDIRVQQIENHLWFWEATGDPLADGTREQVGELLRRIGNYHVTRVPALPEAEQGPSLARAVFFYERSAEYLRNQIPCVNQVTALIRWSRILKKTSCADAEKKLQRAVAVSERILSDDSVPNQSRARAWYNLGIVLWELRMLGTHANDQDDLRRRELEAYRNAAATDPTMWSAHYNRAFMAAELKQDQEAVRAYIRATDVGLTRSQDEVKKEDDARQFGELLARLEADDKTKADAKQLRELLGN